MSDFSKPYVRVNVEVEHVDHGVWDLIYDSIQFTVKNLVLYVESVTFLDFGKVLNKCSKSYLNYSDKNKISC